ncbi:hypothetical protein NDU88_007043 [Pleurodeles waltl]|uniref:Uncharacterized protein n=1 Tax=Pleurodeles waltl TaxID=8319 RepID=A0AAV7QQP2_PLEWA|nr:hypothetical protein NDU88_007043 [Pleurodeles waltl]
MARLPALKRGFTRYAQPLAKPLSWTEVGWSLTTTPGRRQDRDVAFQASRTAPPINWDSAVINFYSGFTLGVRKLCRSFIEVKRALRD